jgi:glycerophosphoryl diester phosphodiesterase
MSLFLLSLLFSLFALCFLGKIKRPVNKNFSEHIEKIAHRGGFEGVAVENSIATIKSAVKSKFKYIEVDVQITKDKQLVLFHDDDLKRLAQINKRIEDLSYLDLTKIELSQGKFNAKIEKLEDLLVEIREHKIFLFLDVKPASRDNLGYVRKIYAMLVEYGVLEYCCITSFSSLVLLYFRLLDQKMALSLSVEKETDDLIAIMLYKIRTLVLPDLLWLNFLLIQNNLFSRDFVERARKNNIQVLAWTINDKIDKDYYNKYKIGYLTDFINQ